MVKHIVMWKLKEENKTINSQRIKQMLESLSGKIHGLLSIEVGIDCGIDGDSYDAVLLSTFESRESLASYQVHPEHVAISTFVKSVREDRKVIDFEA